MRKIASAVAASVALLGIGGGVSQAATVPGGTPSKAVVVERNESDQVTNYKLQNADPMTGRFGYLPLGDGGVYAVNWTKVGKDQVNGTGKYAWGRMGRGSTRRRRISRPGGSCSRRRCGIAAWRRRRIEDAGVFGGRRSWVGVGLG